jgi:hypothetical protein
MMALDSTNYNQGFLVDDDLMGGVTQDPQKPSVYIAFVLQHTTGEYLGYQPFSDLQLALNAINQIQRPWTFERVGGCGGCGEGGSCSKGGCGIGGEGGGCKKGSCAPKNPS